MNVKVAVMQRLALKLETERQKLEKSCRQRKGEMAMLKSKMDALVVEQTVEKREMAALGDLMKDLGQ